MEAVAPKVPEPLPAPSSNIQPEGEGGVERMGAEQNLPEDFPGLGSVPDSMETEEDLDDVPSLVSVRDTIYLERYCCTCKTKCLVRLAGACCAQAVMQ